MTAPRPTIVEALIKAASNGMAKACPDLDATADEVTSAIFSLTLRSIEVCLEKGGSADALHRGVDTLYQALPKETAH